MGYSCRRYFLHFGGGPLPTYNDTHVDYNIRLISGLNENIYNKLLYRFHWQYGYNEIEKVKDEFPDLSISKRDDETHFYRLLNNSNNGKMNYFYMYCLHIRIQENYFRCNCKFWRENGMYFWFSQHFIH